MAVWVRFGGQLGLPETSTDWVRSGVQLDSLVKKKLEHPGGSCLYTMLLKVSFGVGISCIYHIEIKL